MYQSASMFCLSLKGDGLLTYSSGFFLNFYSPIKILFYLNLPENIFVIFGPKKSCDKDYFYPSRDAALPYSPLHGRRGSYLHDILKISEINDSLMHRSRQICCCFKLLLSVDMNKTLNLFACFFFCFFLTCPFKELLYLVIE